MSTSDLSGVDSWWITFRITAKRGDRLSAGPAVIDTPGCGALIGEAAFCFLLSVQMNLCTTDRQTAWNLAPANSCRMRHCVIQRSPHYRDSAKQFIRNHKEVFDWGRLEDVCVNAHNDGRLCDTEARMSHSRRDSACTESRWHHLAIFNRCFPETHTHLFADKCKSWWRSLYI